MRKILALFLILVSLNVAHAQSGDVNNPQTNQSALVTNKGQLPGTTTNDSASAGNVGEYIQSSCPGPTTTATVTITIASPAVISWTTHGFTSACPVVFTTTGALPTGITAGTTYYVVPSSIATSTFQIATTVANALAGTSVNTSGTQSGVQTGKASVAITTGNPFDITGIPLTAGDWDVCGWASSSVTAGGAISAAIMWINTTTATQPTLPAGGAYFITNAAQVTSGNLANPVGCTRAILSGTTTYFLSTLMNFTSTNTAYGIIWARRRR